jgi:hypothetical protein
LAEAFPEIRCAHPGEIYLEDLPELRNIVVVDNAQESRTDLLKLHIKSMVDWREVLIWREDVHESRVQSNITAGLNRDDVINLQFTRSAHSFLGRAAHNNPILAEQQAPRKQSQ